MPKPELTKSIMKCHGAELVSLLSQPVPTPLVEKKNRIHEAAKGNNGPLKLIVKRQKINKAVVKHHGAKLMSPLSESVPSLLVQKNRIYEAAQGNDTPLKVIAIIMVFTIRPCSRSHFVYFVRLKGGRTL